MKFLNIFHKWRSWLRPSPQDVAAGESPPAPAPTPQPVGEGIVLYHINPTCDPARGIYVIEENRACICGTGSLSGTGWVSRKWTSSGGGEYHYIAKDRFGLGNSAMWVPKIRVSGVYEVYVKYAATDGRTTSAVYIIKCATGTVSVVINQSKRTPGLEMRWQKLGEWKFKRGISGYIKLLNTEGQSECADSLAMMKK